MTEYNVKSDDRKKFSFKSNGISIGDLLYEQRYNLKSEILLTNGQNYHFEPKGDFTMTVELKDKGEILLNFKMNLLRGSARRLSLLYLLKLMDDEKISHIISSNVCRK